MTKTDSAEKITYPIETNGVSPISSNNCHNAHGPLHGRTILLVNTGSIKKRFTVQRLKKLGLCVVVLNKDKPAWAQPYVDHWILADNLNHNEALQAVQLFVSSNPNVKIEGVVTFWEDDVLLTSKIVDRFNFIGIPFNIARRIRNKYLFRDFCSEQGINAPKHHLVRTPEDLAFIQKHFEFPVILKPAYGCSSAFVIKVESKDLLENMYQYVRNNISTGVESALADGLDIFVEEFIDGDEVDIDILLQNGKVKFVSIADNYNKSKGIFFVDSGQAIPSSLPVKTQEELVQIAEEALEKLGIQNGCIHFEAKYGKKGVYPIEVNMRMGGDYVYFYTKSAWGIDLIEYAVRIAIGDYFKIEPRETPKKYIIGWDLHPEDSGVLVELDIPEDIKKHKFIEEVQIYKTIGDTVCIPPEGFEHLGWLTVSGENLLDAKDNLDATLELIDFKVVKFDPASFLGKTERKNRFSSAVLAHKNMALRARKIEVLKRIGTPQRHLRIGLLCNIYSAPSDRIETCLTEMAFEIEKTLKAIGYNVVMLNLNDFGAVMDRLKKGDVDLVFNTADRLYNIPENRPHIAGFLDSLQIPYTGSDSLTLSLAADKIRFKKLLTYHEIPTPAWDYLYDLDEEIDDELEYPMIVKPGNTDYSFGISNESVVKNKKELNRQTHLILKKLERPALIEEYIEGDEYEVFILGNDRSNLRVLPLARSIFDDFPKKNWHLYTYGMKWSGEGLANKVQYQLPVKNIPKKLEALITEIALDTYTIFDCHDYGKVEVKVDADGNPYVIELNPNPWLTSSGNKGIVAASKLVGIDYGRLLEEIIRMTVEWYKK